MRKLIPLVLVFAALCTPLFAEEPAPNANLCVVQCKADCVNVAAIWYIQCIEDSCPYYPNSCQQDCTQDTADALADCKSDCEDYFRCEMPN